MHKRIVLYNCKTLTDSIYVLLLLNPGIWMVFFSCFFPEFLQHNQKAVYWSALWSHMDHMTWQESLLPDVGVDVLLCFFPVSAAVPKLRPWKAVSRLKLLSLLLVSGWMILASSWGSDTFLPMDLRWLVSLVLWAWRKNRRNRVKRLDIGQRICLHYPCPW